ncbi:MAG: 1-acyl-sn-glycerol-3-phosphate acyltransferase [Pseudomonadota bacterium]|nr:1-acyl-sn-glycerol-3-phosphate acyltransferase [Pseudomonadota bacterium]
MRRCAALWRLTRATLHVVHGMAIMALRWPRLDPAGRRQRIAWWSAGLLRALGVGLQVRGGSAPPVALVVANHVSWLDIAAIHAVLPQSRFVSKAEVLQWPLLGWLIRGAGTLFIVREQRRDAIRVLRAMQAALAAGDTVAVFPEGTTGTGPKLLPFHANLLQSAVLAAVPIQPVALRFSDAESRFSAAARFVGDTTLTRSLWQVAAARGLRVQVELLQAVDPHGVDRRQLALRLQQSIQDRLLADD